MSNQSSRRNFIQKVATGVVGAALVPEVIRAATINQKVEQLKRLSRLVQMKIFRSPLIGAGGMGQADANTAITIPGVKLIAACDLYDGRLADAKRIYGNDIYHYKGLP